MRDELLAAARRGETVTYGTLMRNHCLSRGLPLIRAISAIDSREYGQGAPGFAAIIVRKDTGFPGGGYFCDEGLPRNLRRTKARGTDPKLSLSEKRHVLEEQKKIWSYYRPDRPV